MNRKTILENASTEAKKFLPANSSENPRWKKTRADLIFAFQNSTDDVFLSAVENYVSTARKLGEENSGREFHAVASPAGTLDSFARPCQTCSCPAVWFSIYDRDSATPTPRCPECEPPPSRHLVGKLFLIVGRPGAGLASELDPDGLTLAEIYPERKISAGGNSNTLADPAPLADSVGDGGATGDENPPTHANPRALTSPAFTDWTCRMMDEAEKVRQRGKGESAGAL